MNSAVISFVIVVTNLAIENQEEARKTILNTISALPHVGQGGMDLYHEHTDFSHDSFCKKEYYVEICQQSIFFANTQMNELEEEIVNELEKQLDEDVLVQIERIQWKVDWSVIRVMIIIVPLLFVLIVCFCATIVWRRKQKEKEDTMLLLS